MPKKVPAKMQAKAAKEINRGVMAVFRSSHKSIRSPWLTATALVDRGSMPDFFCPGLIEINLAADRA